MVRQRAALLLALLVSAVAFCVSGQPAKAQIVEAEAAMGPPLTVAVFVSSGADYCYSRGYVAATRKLATLAQTKINAQGGIGGRPLQLRFFDDERDTDKTIANMRAALAQPDLLAMIGLGSSTRAKATFKVLAKDIGASRVPFISHISVSSIFEKQPNVFSTRPAQEVERVPVMTRFIRQEGYGKVAFLGRAGQAYIDAIGDGLRDTLGAERIVADFRIQASGSGRNRELDEAALGAALTDIKAKGADLVVVAVGSSLTDSVIARMKAAGTTPAILMVGSISRLRPDNVNTYPNPIYELAWDSIPEVEPDAVRNVVSKGAPGDWIFEGRKNPAASGWKDDTCPAEFFPEAYSRTNLRAIGIGAQYADMVNLVATSARKMGRRAKLDDMRKQVLADLGHAYSAGRGAFKGRFEDWSFYPDTRVRAQTPFIVILPQGLGRTQLAPIQFVRSTNGSLRRIDTLYLDIDMIRTHGVDNNEKSFFAEFYLSMRVSDRIGIGDLEFTNAFYDPRSSKPQISIAVVHPGGKSEAYPESMRLYRINGRFRFKPDFTTYPFDTQQFSIDIQPKSGDKPFVIQPPPGELRDKDVAVENWDVVQQYVSSVDDFVPVVDAFTHRPSIVPFYKTRFVWQMKRETTDYFLRVVVPLAFILIVAYLSIFIPQGHIEAIVTIQVTALLSAVALYLSLPQVDSDTATVSDRLFVFDYMMVSVMIVISILRINVRITKLPWVNGILAFTHIAVIPALVAVVVLLSAQMMSLEQVQDLPGIEILQKAAKYVVPR